MKDEKLTLAQAVEKYGKADYSTTQSRLKRGWSVNKSLKTPPRKMTYQK